MCCHADSLAVRISCSFLVAASRLASEREGRDLMRRTSPLVVAYVLLCVAFNGLILYASPDMTGLMR